MSAPPFTVRVEVPGALTYRDVVLRAASSVSRFAAFPVASTPDVQRFSAQVVSAVSEAFNNIVTHGYAGRTDGRVLVGFWFDRERFEVSLTDDGCSFEIGSVPPPDLDALPESGLGVYIIKSFMDDVLYNAGPPNTMVMVKALPHTAGPRTGLTPPPRTETPIPR